MQIQHTAEYNLIKEYYGEQKTIRTNVLLINHIDEGLWILNHIKADLTTQQAYCLHPIFQGDADLLANYSRIDITKISPHALVLVIEYRNIANQYLSARTIASIEEISLSPLKEVNQMLIADKVQNRKDFELYHQHTHLRSTELAQYFKNWLRRLQITEEEYAFYFRSLSVPSGS